MRMIRPIMIFLSLTFLDSCIELYIPDDLESKGSIFIEGLITDNPDIPAFVKISRSVPFELINQNGGEPDKYYVSEAEISILSEDGNTYELTYDGHGIYKYSDFDLIGEPGNSYKVVIHYDGEEFESDLELLRSSPVIDSLGYKVDEKRIPDDGPVSTGYTFNVSTHGNPGEDSFYRWMVDATFSYTVPLRSNYRWIGNHLVPYDNSESMHCWKTNSIPNIFIASTEGLAENEIIEKPLQFESQNGFELSEKYYIHVNQLSVSRKVYNFWKDLDKLINQTDGLYQIQPFRLEGNIVCKTNGNYQVVGIFEAAGASESEKYFDKPEEFPVRPLACTPERVGTLDYPWFQVEENAYIIRNNTSYYTADIQCFDCVSHGGVTEKPAFWEY